MLILLFKIDAKIHLFSHQHKHSWAFFQKRATLTLVVSILLISRFPCWLNTDIV